MKRILTRPRYGTLNPNFDIDLHSDVIYLLVKSEHTLLYLKPIMP